MSRSAVVALVAGVLLVGALIAVDGTYWHWLSMRSHVETALVFGGTFLAACVAAVSIRRIVDPKLDTPVLVWVLMILFFIVWVVVMIASAFSDTRSSRSSSYYNDNSGYYSDRRGFFGRSAPSGKGPPGMGLAWAIAATLLALAVYAGGLYLSMYLAKETAPVTAKPPAPPTTTTTATAPKTPAKPPAPTAPKDIKDVADLAAAIAFARPNLTDSRHAPSEGAKLLVRYLDANHRFSDLVIAKNETSPAAVEKEPPKEMGKRLCASGVLARIEKQTVEGIALYSARLVTHDNDALEVFAVGSTGDLVKRKPAKFCGVVTGRLDVEGKPATFAVGMFETPAEHK